MRLHYAGFTVEIERKRLFKALRSFSLAAIMLASVSVQTVSAFDEDFYSGNDIFFYNPDACKVDAGTGTANLVGKDVPEKIWRFFVDRGLTAEQAAGVLGNIQAESGFDPGVEEKDQTKKSKGFGIAQWTGTRRTQLEAAAKEKGVPVSDLAFQLDYLLQEIQARKPNSSKNFPRYYQGYANEWEALKGQKSIEDSLVAFHNNYERSHLWNDARDAQDAYNRVIAARLTFAQNAYASFKSIGSSGNGGTGEAGGVTKKPVVFLDPGHGGNIPQYIDEKTGLADRETDNGQETKDMLDVANRIKAELEKANYTVILSRTTNDAKVTKRERVDAATAAKADIAVSLHSDTSINQVWYQRVGAYREYNGKHVQFENKEVADKSQTYANAMAATRAANEGNQVSTDADGTTQAGSFGREGVPSKGNISLVQLWASDVPWVYNEISRDVGGTGLSENRKNAYTKGVVEAIQQTVKPSDSSGCTGSNFEGGNLTQTTLAYAWPTYKGLTVVAKDEWQVASRKARGEGRYIGGIQYPGIDCGGFVTTLLVDSGYEPNYNHGGKLSEGAGATPTQRAWTEANWALVGKGSDIDVGTLLPGDVAHLPGHTFVYVGKISGFESVIASASLDERAPMAGKENLSASNTTWYRKKGPSTSTGGSGQERL